MDVLSTREVIRATTYYNPTIYGSGNGEKNRENITKNIEQYAARKGGYWNYDGLFDLVRAVLSGLSAELARSQLNSLSGPGEAKAKTILFDFLEKEIGLSKNIAVEPEVWRNTLPNGKTIQCRADFAYREKQSNDVIFVFSYPNKEPPLRDEQRKSLVSFLGTPRKGFGDERRFALLEFPGDAKGNRTPFFNIFDFSYGEKSEDFISHLESFSDLKAQNDSRGDLFG